MRSVDPDLAWTDVQMILDLTADKVAGMAGEDYTEEYGYGRLNAFYAVAPPAKPPVSISLAP